MSSCSFEMSMPTMTFAIGTHPCACGLALRPERLFGLSGKDASGDTCSPTVLLSLDARCLPPAGDPRSLTPCAGFKIQGCERRYARAGGGQILNLRLYLNTNGSSWKELSRRSDGPIWCPCPAARGEAHRSRSASR